MEYILKLDIWFEDERVIEIKEDETKNFLFVIYEDDDGNLERIEIPLKIIRKAIWD